MSDARATHPIDFRLLVQFFPEEADFARVLPDEQRAVAVHDAIHDEPVGRQVRVCAGKTVADMTGIGVNRHPGRSPVGELVGAISDASARDGSVKDEGFKFGNFHKIRKYPSGLEVLLWGIPCETRRRT